MPEVIRITEKLVNAFENLKTMKTFLFEMWRPFYLKWFVSDHWQITWNRKIFIIFRFWITFHQIFMMAYNCFVTKPSKFRWKLTITCVLVDIFDPLLVTELWNDVVRCSLVPITSSHFAKPLMALSTSTNLPNPKSCVNQLRNKAYQRTNQSIKDVVSLTLARSGAKITVPMRCCSRSVLGDKSWR